MDKKRYKILNLLWAFALILGLFACGEVKKEEPVKPGSEKPVNENAYMRDDPKMVIAAELGDTAELQKLLNNKQDVNIQAKDGTTPLMAACKSGKLEAIKLLLKAGAKPDLRDEMGRSALMFAFKSGSKEAISLLLGAGAKLSVSDNSGKDPLNYAQEGKDKNIAFYEYVNKLYQ